MHPYIDPHAIVTAAVRIAILIFRETGEIVQVNNEATRLYGYSYPELVGRNISELVLEPTETAKLFQLMPDRDIQADNPPPPYRRFHRRSDGTKVAVTIALGSFQSTTERLFVKYVVDASSVEQMEHELEESQHRFKAVADYTYDWETWLDQNGTLIWVNPAVERLAGYSVSECKVMKDYPLPIVLAEDQEKVRSLIAQALLGSSGNDVEFRIRDKQGFIKWIAVSWQPLISESGNPVGVRMSMRDIDDRKIMEQQLRDYALHLERLAEERAEQIVLLESERAKIERLAALGKLAANVAHEINNPLAGIKNAFHILKNEARRSKDEHGLIQLIDKEIERMAQVLRQMTQLYRPGLTLASTFDARDVIRQLVTLLGGEAALRGVQFDIVSMIHSCEVYVPEIEFRQILHNLLLNAVEASPHGGTVTIFFEEVSPKSFTITVRDMGSGISPAIHSKIFEPFFSTKNTPNRPGSGLGLAISKSLASAIGVGLEHLPHESPGAAFRVTIPSRTHS
jgi:PAS domain S-box-containing protein